MAVSETSGKTYDVKEFSRLDDFINTQEEEMKRIDLEKSVQNKKILRYTLILTGVVLAIFVFSKLIDKKK